MNRVRMLRHVFALVPLILTGACVSGNEAQAPSNELNQRLAELICTQKEGCCPQSYDGDRERCLAIEKISASTRAHRIEAAVDAGSARYDDARFRECLEALDTLDCNGWYAAAADNLPLPCLDYTEGTKAVGATCDDYFECASGHCAYTPSGEGRTCQPSGQLGDTCQGSDDECAVELQCWGGTCVQRLAAGGACTDHGECSSGECSSGACAGACKLDFR